jgi:hypothetical protein
MTTRETADEKATRLLNEKLKELEIGCGPDYKSPQFRVWRVETETYLEKFLPPSHQLLKSFKNLCFTRGINTGVAAWGSPRATRLRQLEQRHFAAECRTAQITIIAALKHIAEFGVHVEQAKAVPERSKGTSETISHGGVQQNFYGSVEITSQAIATGKAIQNIGEMGQTVGVSLKEIAALFEQSGELKQREVKEGLAGIEALAVEIQKPEPKRDWKSVLDYGQKVLAVAGKATDLAHKLAPYTPHVVTLVKQARHFLKL